MFSEKSPYLITILIGAIAWLFTHVADRLTNTNFIEYNISEPSEKSQGITCLRITNITQTFILHKLIVRFAVPDQGKMKSLSVFPEMPAFEGDDPPIVNGATATFEFPRIQPGATYTLKVGYEGPKRPQLWLISPDDTVYFTTPSLETFVVRNQTSITMWLLAGGLFILAVVSLLSTLLTKRQTEPVSYSVELGDDR